MQMSRDKRVELAQQCSRVHWLEQYNASLIAWLGDANSLVADLGVQDRAREEELDQARSKRDTQRAAAEQKAQEVELQQKDAALERRAAKLQRKEDAITALSNTLVQKDVVLETQGVVLCDAETALEEKGWCFAMQSLPS
jgi:hypothetical protein